MSYVQKHIYISDIFKRDNRMLKRQTMTGVNHVFPCLLLCFCAIYVSCNCITVVDCSSTVFGFFFNRLIFHIL